MNIFLDTSSLFKLYHTEQGTEIIDKVFIDNKIVGIFLSEIAKIEFASTIWKKVRTQEITELQAIAKIDNSITRQAKELIAKYGKEGLRTLDSLQLASALEVKDSADKYFTSDQLLSALFIKENLPV